MGGILITSKSLLSKIIRSHSERMISSFLKEWVDFLPPKRYSRQYIHLRFVSFLRSYRMANRCFFNLILNNALNLYNQFCKKLYSALRAGDPFFSHSKFLFSICQRSTILWSLWASNPPTLSVSNNSLILFYVLIPHLNYVAIIHIPFFVYLLPTNIP